MMNFADRWFHIVSKDLAHWQVVSTTPEKAMLSPDQPYDSFAVMTGSVTIVDGVPKALYSCRGPAEKEHHWGGAVLALVKMLIFR